VVRRNDHRSRQPSQQACGQRRALWPSSPLPHCLQPPEGSLAAVSCTAQGPEACGRSTCCATKSMWDKLDNMIDEFFEGITLADLLKQ
jgi:hypothetical protein